MISLNPEECNGLFPDIPRMTGTQVIESNELRAGRKRNRSILFKLDVQVVREVILN